MLLFSISVAGLFAGCRESGPSPAVDYGVREAQVYRIDPGSDLPFIHLRICRGGTWAIYDHIEDHAPIGFRKFLFYAHAPCDDLLTRPNIVLVGVDPFEDEEDGWEAPTIVPNGFTLGLLEVTDVDTRSAPNSSVWQLSYRGTRRSASREDCQGLDVWGVSSSLQLVAGRFLKHYGLDPYVKLPPRISAAAFLASDQSVMTDSQFWRCVDFAKRRGGDALDDHMIQSGAATQRSFNAHLCIWKDRLALGDLRMLQRHLKPHDFVDEFYKFKHWVILQGEEIVRSVVEGDLSPLVERLVRIGRKRIDAELYGSDVLDYAAGSSRLGDSNVYGLGFWSSADSIQKGRITADGSLLDVYPALNSFYKR